MREAIISFPLLGLTLDPGYCIQIGNFCIYYYGLIIAVGFLLAVFYASRVHDRFDISMDDGKSAEGHARQVLRQDRDNKLANYVMGSLRLRAGEYLEAEAFLRRSAAAERPLAAAQNDLAEVLHRLKRYEEAETFARAAVKTDPNLYVAWETLGSTLLDQNKNLDEAELCVNKAISLSKATNKDADDVRMYLTLARVQIAKGDDRSRSQAKATLRKIRDRKSELSAYDLGEFEKLQKAVQVKR